MSSKMSQYSSTSPYYPEEYLNFLCNYKIHLGCLSPLKVFCCETFTHYEAFQSKRNIQFCARRGKTITILLLVRRFSILRTQYNAIRYRKQISEKVRLDYSLVPFNIGLRDSLNTIFRTCYFNLFYCKLHSISLTVWNWSTFLFLIILNEIHAAFGHKITTSNFNYKTGTYRVMILKYGPWIYFCKVLVRNMLCNFI